MLKLEEWMDIRTLHNEGHSISLGLILRRLRRRSSAVKQDTPLLAAGGTSFKEIARQMGRSRNTVRQILGETGPASFSKPERDSCLDNFKPIL
jgi:hypothetical protein